MAEEGTLASHILPVETAFAVYPAVTVTEAQATRFCNGGELAAERLKKVPAEGELARVTAPDNTFLGLGRLEGETLQVVRVFV